MRQRLFTKEIDNKLFSQYKYGSDLSKQMVIAKIFNPYNNGVWFIINSDPNDPDYLWAIVDLFEIEAGSVSREDLQTIKVPPFGLNLERDLYFQPINAQELYDRLRQGERFEDGGKIKLGDVVEVREPNYGYDDSYYVVNNKSGYDENGFLISPTSKRLGDVFEEEQLRKLYEHGGSIDVIQNDKDESYLTSVNAKPNDAAIKLAHGGMSESIEVGDLVRVKKYGFIMRVDKIDGNMYFLENDKRGSMNGNNGSYLISDIEKYEKYADGGATDDYTKSLALVTVKFINPEYNYSTNLSGSVSEADARKYFVGKSFNVGKYPKENMQKCIDIDFKAKGTYADGGETAKSWTVMYFKEGKNRFGEKIESAFNNTRVQGTLKEAIEKVKEELVGNITYATIKDRSIGDVLVAKVKQDGTINIYREGYGIDKMADGGEINEYKYKTNFYGINIYTNVDQTYINELYSPFESKGSFKANVRRIDFESIALESDSLKKYNFVYGKDDGKTIAQKLKQNGVNDLELIKVGKIITTFVFVPINKMAKGGTTKNYIYVPKSDIKEIDAVIGGKEQKISGKDVLDGAYVKKSVPKVDKVKLSERAQILLDSTLESFERQNDRQRAASIKQVEDNLAANKKGIDNIGMGLDEDMVAAGEEFIRKVKSKEYTKAYKNTFDYSQGQLNLKAKKLAEDKGISYKDLGGNEYKIQLCQAFVAALTDANFHSEAKNFVADLEKEKWSDKLYKSKYYDASDTVREFGVSVSQMSSYEGDRIAEVFVYLLRMNGSQNLADSIEELFSKYAKGGVTFKDKVKSISNSLKGKKVPSKLKKDYGATYDKKESVLAATRIAGAMKAKMESKKKR